MSETHKQSNASAEKASGLERKGTWLLGLSVVSTVGSAIFNELNKLKAKILPTEAPSLFSWGSNNKFTKAQPWALLGLGVASFIGALFSYKKANEALPVAKSVNPDDVANISALTSESRYVERYQKEVSANEITR